MKSLSKLLLVAALFTTAASAHAEWVSGHFRSNGTYVQPYRRSDFGIVNSSPGDFTYRNPYAAKPSVHVDWYYRRNGTYVAPHYRTPANNTLADNLSYRGYGTARVPRYSYGW